MDTANKEKSLPPALLARLAKRGIVATGANPSAVASTLSQATLPSAPSVAPSSPPAPSVAPSSPQPAVTTDPGPCPHLDAHAFDPQGLPPGWREARDTARGLPYFYHPLKGFRSWNLPPGSGPHWLPEGWRVGHDATGHRYYYNKQLCRTIYDHPVLLDVTPVEAPTSVDNMFRSSTTWAGCQPGFVFKKGLKGVGYYWDDVSTEARIASTSSRPPVVGVASRPAAPVSQVVSRTVESTLGLAPGEGASAVRKSSSTQGGASFPHGVDPMDPSAYSDAKKGGWGVGLGRE